MRYNIRVSLSLSHSEKKIADRIREIKTAAPYLKYFENPEINVFEVTLNKKEEFKAFLHIIEKSFKNEGYIPFNITGWKIQKVKKSFKLYFSVATSEESGLMFKGLSKEIKKYLASDRFPVICPGDCFDICIAESRNPGEFGFLLEKLGVKKSLISGLFLKTIYRNEKKPLHSPRKLFFKFDVIHAVIYRNEKIYGKFSLPLNEWIRPGDNGELKKSFEKYRILKNYQLQDEICLNDSKKTNKIFLSSDLHLNHDEIIEMTARPFFRNDVKTMNEVLISNWNKTVGVNDTVIFTGDMTYQTNSEYTDYTRLLNGNIIFVRGNHDADKEGYLSGYEMVYKGYNFYFVHNPAGAPENYKGWIVHGHTHNSRMEDYPFINFENQTINICCELTEYRPVDMEELIDIISRYQNADCKKIYSLEIIQDTKNNSEINN